MDFVPIEYLDNFQNWLMTSGIRVAAIIIFGLLGARLLRMIATKTLHRFMVPRHGHEEGKRADTLAGIIRSVIMISALALIFTM
ncbi:MAG TPA: hypothetical protein VLB27_12200, partial [candidate division Zixibacteria bacterium]|nr:hypothetical protein [candidate division Zixibacteria bacterium]